MKAELMNEEIQKIIDDSKQSLNDYLMYKGEPYPTDQWLTITEYCKRFDIKDTHTVTNWIRRGVIPAENVVTIPEYNNIRLVKAIPYHE